MNGSLGLDGGDGSVDIFGDDITAIKQAAGHVFAVTRIAFDHLSKQGLIFARLSSHPTCKRPYLFTCNPQVPNYLVGGLETGVSDFGHGELLVVRLFGGNDGRVSSERKMDTRIRHLGQNRQDTELLTAMQKPGILGSERARVATHEIRLEFSKIDIERAVETKRGRDGRDDLRQKPVEIGVRGTFDVQITPTDVVQRLVINHERAIGVLQRRVGDQQRVVRFDDRRGDLRFRKNVKPKTIWLLRAPTALNVVKSGVKSLVNSPEGTDKRRILTWTSCRSRQTIAP